jgi:hypothetical protein
MKKHTVLIFLITFAVAVCKLPAQVIQFDLNKKKKEAPALEKQQTESSTYLPDDEEEEVTSKKKKEKKTSKPAPSLRPLPEELDEEKPDFKKGLFKALFFAGVNACQVDGDDAAGYYYLGAHAGVGTLVKFHKHLSVSMELLYNMKGAQRRLFGNNQADSSLRLVHDYVQIPLLFNVHDKRIVIFSAGVSVGYMVRFRQFFSGRDYTNPDPSAPIAPQFLQEPRRWDLCAEVGVHFVIKEQFALGGRFSYSLIGMRDALPATRVAKQYNNVLTFRFMYILKPLKKN